MSRAAEVRALRAEIRHWRRGRADARLVDVLGDVYIGIFATLMFGSMLANVVINVGRVAGGLCTSTGCREGRTALPWLVALAALVVVVGLARLFGPVFVSPATASWLLPAPVDRPALLRPRLVLAAAAAALGAALLTAAGTTLGGFAVGPVAAFSVSVALLAAGSVGATALAQSGHDARGRALVWALGALLAGGLLVVALGAAPTLEPRDRLDAATWAVVAGSVLVALVAVPLAVLRLGRLRDRDVAAGGALAPGLSGALASLDLALLYDVLLAHRWRRRASVRPVRHRAVGQAALVATDLTRLRRSPQLLVLPALAVVLPYAVAATGAGRVVLLVAAFAGFVTGLPLLAGLRVLTRTPALLRMLPFGVAESRRLALRVPALVLLLFGLACAPAVDRSVDADGVTATSLGVAVGTAALAAAVRWVTGRPPDYTRPLVSTPAGGVPTNLYGSVVRGFDVLLLATAPLLLSPTSSGAAWSVAVSVGVLAYLTGRR